MIVVPIAADGAIAKRFSVQKPLAASPPVSVMHMELQIISECLKSAVRPRVTFTRNRIFYEIVNSGMKKFRKTIDFSMLSYLKASGISEF